MKTKGIKERGLGPKTIIIKRNNQKPSLQGEIVALPATMTGGLTTFNIFSIASTESSCIRNTFNFSPCSDWELFL